MSVFTRQALNVFSSAAGMRQPLRRVLDGGPWFVKREDVVVGGNQAFELLGPELHRARPGTDAQAGRNIGDLRGGGAGDRHFGAPGCVS